MHVQQSAAARSSASRALNGVRRGVAIIGSALSARFRLFRQRASQRQALARLNDRLLRDVGLSREEADAEASKPFWLE
jgi:uncharacterized protein YjiS (DUF1127 family)